MATTIGKLSYVVTADSSGVSSGLGKAKSEINAFKTQMNASGGSGGMLQSAIMGGAAGGLAGAAAGALAGVGSAVLGAGASAIKAASDYEQLSISFKVMLGSAEKAQAMLAEIRQFGATTPFESKDLAGAAQTMLQFGVSGESIMPTLRMLGDVSGGNAEKLKGLSLVFGQISSAGKMTGGDLLQMINNGFNPLKTIADATGESYATLRKRMEEGGISAGMVTEALKVATGEGGQFFGMMEEKGKSIEGVWSSLQDEITMLAEDIGTDFKGAIIAAIKAMIELVKIVREAYKDIRWLFGFEEPKLPGKIKQGTEAARELKGAAAEAAGALKGMLSGGAESAISGAIDETKEKIASLKNELDELKKDFDKKKENIESKRNTVGAADRFSMAGFEAVSAGQREGLIQKELKALRDSQARDSERIVEELRKLNDKELPEPIKVTEGRI